MAKKKVRQRPPDEVDEPDDYEPPDLTDVRVHSPDETAQVIHGLRRKKRLPGRPAGTSFLDHSKVRALYRVTVYLEPQDIEYLNHLGAGSRSQGLRRAISIARDTLDHLDLPTILQLARKAREQ